MHEHLKEKPPFLLMMLLLVSQVFLFANAAEKRPSKNKVKYDIADIIASNSRSFSRVSHFEIISSEQLAEDRAEYIVELALALDEAAVARSRRQNERSQLMFGANSGSRHMQRHITAAEKEDGATYTLQVLYKVNDYGVWTITTYQEAPCELTRLGREDKSNCRISESQMKKILNEGLLENSNGEFYVDRITILNSQQVTPTHLAFSVEVKFMANAENIPAEHLESDLILELTESPVPMQLEFELSDNGYWHLLDK